MAARREDAGRVGEEDVALHRHGRGLRPLRRHRRARVGRSRSRRSTTSTARCGASCAMHVPIPFSPSLEDVTVPTERQVVRSGAADGAIGRAYAVSGSGQTSWIRVPQRYCRRLGGSSGNQNLRHDGGGLGAADRFRSAAPRAPGRIKKLLAEVGAGRGALLRHEQRPLHHGHAHRHVGAGQDQPLHAAAAERRADPLGLRLRRAAPPAQLRLAGRALARRHPADARRDDARDGPLRGRRPQDQASSSRRAACTRSRSASTSSSRRCCSRCRRKGSTSSTASS